MDVTSLILLQMKVIQYNMMNDPLAIIQFQSSFAMLRPFSYYSSPFFQDVKVKRLLQFAQDLLETSVLHALRRPERRQVVVVGLFGHERRYLWRSIVYLCGAQMIMHKVYHA